MAFKSEGKEMYPNFVFAKCCSMRTANGKIHPHTSSAISRQVYAHALLVQHLYRTFFQHIV